MHTELTEGGGAEGSRFVARDGVAIAYETFGDPGGLPVVLHHGFAASTLVNWVLPGIVTALVSRRRFVVSIDARGHGRSDKPRDPALYGEPTMARDVVDLVDRLGFAAYDLVGYSMGAIVALLVAAEDARVRRLVVSGVGAAAVELGGVDRRVLAPAAVVAALEADDPGSIEDPMAREFRLFADMTQADRAALAAQARRVHDRTIPFDRIHAETLVIAGEDDLLAARPEVLARALGSATLERVLGGHMNAIADPRFSEVLATFLA